MLKDGLGRIWGRVVYTSLVLLSSGWAGLAAEEPTGASSPVVLAEQRSEAVEKRSTNQRVWEIVKDIEVLDATTGTRRVEQVVSNAVQVGDGICYQDAEGVWQAADTRWETAADGFVMDRAGYSLRIGKTLGTWLEYDVGGHTLRLRPSRIVADDGTYTETIGILNDTAAGTIDPNDGTCLVFADAFGTGIDLTLQARPGGYHQNVIFHGEPTLTLAFDANGTNILVYTEMDLEAYAESGSLETRVGTSIGYDLADFDIVWPSADGVSDAVNAMAPTAEDITFVRKDTGTSCQLHRFGQSEVFDSGESAGRKEDVARKQIRHDEDGHTYLVERLDHRFFQGAAYPVVWDYSTVYGTLSTDTVWYACNTYFVDPCGLDVTVDNCELKIEPGAIVKMGAYGGRVRVSNGGRIIARGKPYLPIVFTSANDDENGESLGGYSSGYPQGGDYDGLVVEDGSQVEYCSFFYAGRAVEVEGEGVIAIQHNRFYWVEQAVYVYDPCEMTAGDSVTIFNNLMIADPCNCSAMIEVNGGSLDGQGAVRIRNNTIHGAYIGIQLYDSTTSIVAINNILSGCVTGVKATSIGNSTFNYNGYYNNTTDFDIPYASKGGGSRTVASSPFHAGQDFYVDETYGTDFLDVGPSSPAEAGYAEPAAWSIHYPQHEFTSSTSISSNTVWGPEYDTCDNDSLVDLGYHYPRIDYVIRVGSGHVAVSGSGVELTVQAGTVVAHAVDSSSGAGKLIVGASSSLVCAGGPFADGYITWVSCGRIQWSGAGCVPYGNLQNFIELESESDYDIRFTRFLGLGMALAPGEGSGMIRDSVFMLNARGVDYRNCEDYSVENCLFMGNLMGVRAWHDAEDVGRGIVRSCTFDRNWYGVVIPGTAEVHVTVTDCLFHTHCREGAYEGHGISYRNTSTLPADGLTEHHNCFFGNERNIYDTERGGAVIPTDPAYDKLPGSDPYDAGWEDFGDRFCLAQGGDCIGAGYDPLSAGKPFYTTGLDKRGDVGAADIGYHYPGVVRFVDAAKTDGDQTGLAWDSAYQYLQDALDECASTHITAICVKAGTYYPDVDSTSGPGGSDNRSETFALTDGLALYGGFAGTENPWDCDLNARDFATNETILSGDIDKNGIVDSYNSYSVVVCEAAVPAVMDGFTIQQGNSDSPTSYLTGCGGGLLNFQGSLTVRKCRITNNKALYGGGVYDYYSTGTVMKSCLITNNEAQGTNYGLGGGIYCEGSTGLGVVSCTISKNSAGDYGGGIVIDAAETDIENSILWGNSAGAGSDFVGVNFSTIAFNYNDYGEWADDGTTSFVEITGVLSANPLFADAAGGDFHLKSSAGRWTSGGWVTDSVTSPCINAGDPVSAWGNESVPNGGRSNMGVYGNTGQASQSDLYPLVVTLITNDGGALPGDAKWYLNGQSGVLYDSGQAIMVSPGSHTIRFVIDSGDPYIEPAAIPITVTSSSVNQYTGTYVAAGAIQFLCYYFDDYGSYSTSNVGWKVSTESSFHNGLRKYIPGTYTVQFQSVDEHATPNDIQINVTKGSYNYPYEKEYQRRTFYVDVDSGSDSNKGGALNRFGTIQKAFNMVPSGGSIYLRSDNSTIYEGVTFPLSNRACTIRSDGSGDLTVHGNHTPDSCPDWVTPVWIHFQEW